MVNLSLVNSGQLFVILVHGHQNIASLIGCLEGALLGPWCARAP